MEYTRRTPANAMFSVPTFVEQWAASPAAIDYLKTFDFVATGGGPLVPDKGRLLAKEGVNLQFLYGGSEIGGVALIEPHNYPDVEDGFMWMRLAPEVPVRWAPQADGSFELQFLTSDDYLVAVKNVADGYSTSDLVVRHPTHDDLFRMYVHDCYFIFAAAYPIHLALGG
jgi:hypothetical protein